MPPNDLTEFLESLRDPIATVLRGRAPDKYRIPLSAPTFGVDEILEAMESLLSQNVTMGRKVARFEEQFATHLGSRHAIMVNSGSSANLLIFAALTNPLCPKRYRLDRGDEVIVPAVTWSTSIWPIIQAGCVPVFVDIDGWTLTLSPKACAKAIGERTKAIFVTHTLGNACDLGALKKLATDRNLMLLEDCCEALGTRYDGTFVGRFGVASSFSFFFSHHITTIEGGMVVTDDDELADLLRCLRAHGWVRDMRTKDTHIASHPEIDPRFLFVNVGYNLRPSEISAAFGLHQLPKLEAFNTHRRMLGEFLRDELADCDDLRVMETTPLVDNTWFGFPALLAPRHASRRNAFMRYLESHGIETRPIIAGNLAVQPAIKHFAHRIGSRLPNAEAVAERGIYWGSHPGMDSDEMTFIAERIRAFFADVAKRHEKESTDNRNYRPGWILPS